MRTWNTDIHPLTARNAGGSWAKMDFMTTMQRPERLDSHYASDVWTKREDNYGYKKVGPRGSDP